MHIIAVDLGGTNTRVAHATDPMDPTSMGFPLRRENTHNYCTDLQFIITAAKALARNEPIDALGISVPGRVDSQKSRLVASNNLCEWVVHDFCTDLSRALHCPVYMDSDGLAAGRAEMQFGSVQGNFHYLIWGTGISSFSVGRDSGQIIQAICLRLRHYEHFEAWEDRCGGTALVRKYGKLGELLRDDEWIEVCAQFTQYLQEYTRIANPPAIILSGGLALRHCNAITAVATLTGVSISVSAFGQDSGLIGSLDLVRRTHQVVPAKVNKLVGKKVNSLR